jgi:hypothetical protein
MTTLAWASASSAAVFALKALVELPLGRKKRLLPILALSL